MWANNTTTKHSEVTMSNNKQSSVDILCQKLANKLGLQAITFYIDHAEEIAEAKAMHKEEIEKAWWAGCDESLSNNIIHPSEDCNGYYNETFKIK